MGGIRAFSSDRSPDERGLEAIFHGNTWVLVRAAFPLPTPLPQTPQTSRAPLWFPSPRF